MPETNNSIPTAKSLPENYEEVLNWKITDKTSRVVALQILAVIPLIIFGFIFYELALSLGKMSSGNEFSILKYSDRTASYIAVENQTPITEIGISILSIFGGIGLIVAVIALTFVLHELIHGSFMRLYGAKPRYGVLWGGMMFYATSPGYPFNRNRYLVIALAPLVLISFIVVLGMWLLQGTLWVSLLVMSGSLNASGAIGDMWITMIVFRYPANALITDERDGIRVFLPKS